MFKILLISVITFILVIIIFLLLMSFMNVDIITNSKPIEKFDIPPLIHYIKTSRAIIFEQDTTIPNVLIIGGGGGGGRNNGMEGGSGGGAGGYVLKENVTFKRNTVYVLTIGKGGIGGTYEYNTGQAGDPGKNTSIQGDTFNFIALGGGGGGNFKGGRGASGGGGSGYARTYDGGEALQGNIGGTGNHMSVCGGGGGGGGGSISSGLTGSYCSTYKKGTGGEGGAGKEYYGTIYCNGGRGGDSYLITNPINRQDPQQNTGSGGFGSSYYNRKTSNGSNGVILFVSNNPINYFSYDIDNNNMDVNYYKAIIVLIKNLFKTKIPSGMYFAYDADNNILIDTSGNKKNAIIEGSYTKNNNSLGFGVLGNFKTISNQSINTYITWPERNIKEKFTLLSLTRYTRQYDCKRILTTTTANFLHGHWACYKGMVHYERFNVATSKNNNDWWLSCIGTNDRPIINDKSYPTLIVDDVAYVSKTDSIYKNPGELTLTINKGYYNESSFWALACVITWEEELNFGELILLNEFLRLYKTYGDSFIIGCGIKQYDASTRAVVDGVLPDSIDYTINSNKFEWTLITTINNPIIPASNSNNILSYSVSNAFVLRKIHIIIRPNSKYLLSKIEITYSESNSRISYLINKEIDKSDHLKTASKDNNLIIIFLPENEVFLNSYIFNFKLNNDGRGNINDVISSIELYSGIKSEVQSTIEVYDPNKEEKIEALIKTIQTT